MTITSGLQKSQCTAGTYRRGEPSKLRRSCEALPASRIRSSSSRTVFSYSRTTSMGLRRLLPSQLLCAKWASACSTSRSRAITACMPGRSTLTTTSRVFAPLRSTSGRSSAACTCAMDAAASGCLLERREHLLGGAAVGLLDDGARDAAVEGRHAVLELGELLGDVRGQQVAARGQRLAELHENRARAPAAPRAAATARGSSRRRTAQVHGDSRNRNRNGRYRWVARTNSSSPCRTSTRWISISLAMTRSFIAGSPAHRRRPAP